MYGAIIGDLAGSIYEYNQTKEIKNIKINNIIEKDSFYSDDTILTIAILDAIMNDKDYEKYLKYYIQKYKDYHPNFSPYFKSAFSPSLIKWSEGLKKGNSAGNGAIMRLSPVGNLFDSEGETRINSILATLPSHNNYDSLNSSMTVALLIYYLRLGNSKDEAYEKLNINLEYKPFKTFNKTCKETLNNCLYIAYYSNSFEDSIEKIIYEGGDTDTNACIVGSITESMYGISESLINEANKKLPDEFVYKLRKVKR